MGVIGAALIAAPLAAAPAHAAETAVFINEFHYDNDGADVGEAIEVAAAPGTDLTGWSIVLYNGSNGASYGTLPLSGTVGATATVVVPAPGMQNGSPDGLALVNGTTVVEFLSYEGVMTATNGPASGMTSVDVGVSQPSNAPVGSSLQRIGTGDVASAFTWTGPATSSFGTINSGQTFAGISGPEIEEPGPAVEATIAEIQGTGSESPFHGDLVITTGIVTAAYPTGGYSGYFIQTQGTGTIGEGHAASDAVFVYSPSTVGSVSIGDLVEVTGEVDEFNGLTEVIVESADDLTIVDDNPATGVTPAAIAIPGTVEGREALEGMLLAPQGDFTVSNNYTTNQYADIGLAVGTAPLIQPTEIARPGTAEYAAVVADNAARAITLDDGASIDFLIGDARNTPLPYLTTDVISVGAPVTFTSPMIFDFRNNTWKLQPTTQLTVENAATVQTAEFGEIRVDEPEDVGGDVSLASFNVLNYFTTTGDELTGCIYYRDRNDNPISVDEGCDARGAANDENLARQQVKIVAAINALDADVVSLAEIENSAAFDTNRDEALSHLVDALNADLDGEVWDFVPSPAAVPADEDVIRSAFIYRSAAIAPIGESSILLNSPAFGNAREPLAQAFRPVGGDESTTFVAIANHFKSKSSGSGPDADQNDGQGASNASRVAQAQALVTFADQQAAAAATDMVFLTGDFNAYTQEDPMKVFYDAGYTDLGSTTGEYTYAFQGRVGSLDHIIASPAAAAAVTGVDIWNINAGEPVALEYSRYNYNATLFYDESVFRSSDHDPVIVGLDLTSDTGITVDRVAGANRYEVASNISQAAYPETAPVVYVASGENYPDALSAGPAAAAEGGPLLLVRPNELPTVIASEIARLQPSKIVVVGGTASVSEGVFNDLAALADETVRIAGANRYEVSRAVAEYAFGAADVPLVYVATGEKFPDALAAGGAAGSQGAPVVLVRGSATDLDADTATLLADLGTSDTRVLGGEASVTPGVFEDVAALTTAVRLGGVDRYEAARSVNADAFDAADRAFVATGANFPDALAGSAWAASAGAPLFLAPGTCVTAGVLADFESLGVDHVTLLGGEASLYPDVFALTPCTGR
ncbi:ExeM/NucH family extracellular endonuclease [Antiquaquibacter oligotrophicus]|uniref:ExeM/NucH family extracellular endonuclease n=1 Tax=Antiquaquibacter oligotrophicus TaxID=2880260 RepID=UPI002AC89C6F|nr:ExeM/NucH family extracellular endonuclease [Antiquaquibacter oligotrophicus]